MNRNSRRIGQGRAVSETEKFRRRVSELVSSGYVPLVPQVTEIANGTQSATKDER